MIPLKYQTNKNGGRIMKKLLVFLLAFSFFAGSMAFANENKMSIDPGWGVAPMTTVYTFLSFDQGGYVNTKGPFDLKETWTYNDVSAAVQKYGVVEHKDGYPDVLYVEPYFYFIYYDDTYQNILNIFIIDEHAFYENMILY